MEYKLVDSGMNVAALALRCRRSLNTEVICVVAEFGLLDGLGKGIRSLPPHPTHFPICKTPPTAASVRGGVGGYCTECKTFCTFQCFIINEYII